MPRNSLTPRRSSTKGGVNSFCFIDGSKSVPPAMTFTSSACLDRKAMASSRVLGRSNWKVGRLTLHLLLMYPAALDQEDAVRGLYRETTETRHVRAASLAASGQYLPSCRSSSSLAWPATQLKRARE